ncbi:unnamed protein product [Symbiodinium pilosum]|uniref:Homing endonuclease LAGLIDADG domain-containing protein n=1 Tax=Symbiodinium pilosum TaxID=2952 RepID=A0A812X875_SYMPI|nr:unnamed protein product [Symbiodinium pilosum]
MFQECRAVSSFAQRSFWSFRHSGAIGRVLIPAGQRYASSTCRTLGQDRPAAEPMADRPVVLDVAAPDDSLEALLGKNVRLHAKLQTMQWPPLSFFVANRCRYTLPWNPHGQSATCSPSSTAELQYLAGLFDGDGSCVMDRGTLYIQVAQTFDAAAGLLRFQSAFGGGIYRKGDGLGLHKPMLYWRVAGCNARQAAQYLARHSIVKRKQLELGVNLSQRPSRMPPLLQELKTLKRCDSAVESSCTWEYVAGFFDAEGSIHQIGKAALKLSIAQKFGTVLTCLCKFVNSEMGVHLSVTACRNQGSQKLNIHTTSICKDVLRNMLNAGLLRKARPARLALDLSPDNAEQTRAALYETTGNQQFLKRLDGDGHQRARRIINAQNAARRAAQRGQLEERLATLRQVEELKANHVLEKARLENSRLHEYISGVQHLQQDGLPALPMLDQVAL